MKMKIVVAQLPCQKDMHLTNEVSVIMATAHPLTDRKNAREIWKCHFLASLAKRPDIFSDRILIRKNLGTIGLTHPKVAKTRNATLG